MRDRGDWIKKSGPESNAAKGLRRLYKRYQASCRENNVYFDLTLEKFNAITKKLCEYCGRPPLQKAGLYLYNGIDRMDSSRGYTEDNCAPCCWECNRIKSNKLSPLEMKSIGAILREIRLKKQKE